MAFIGNTNTTQAFTPAVDYFSGNGSTTAFTLSRPVASVAQVQAVVNNVAQNPSDAFTVSGNTITFTSAPSSGTNNIYVYYTSPITQVIAPGQGTVGTTQLQNGLTVNFADGTAAAPSITNDGDTNTGVFYPAADTVGVSTGGSERVRVDSSGNVGIGTSSPSVKLDVATDSNTAINLTYARNANAGSSAYAISGWGNNSSSNAGQVAIASTANTGYGGGGDFIFLANTGDMTLRTTTAKPITFYTNSTLSASITSAGLFQFNSGYGSVATAYGCRAWVNFNGTGVVAIRASGNVSSITDNGTGDYTVNFTTAMSDANYSATITSGYHTVTWGLIYFNAAFTTSACRFITTSPSEVDVDNQIVCATFIR